MKRPNPRRGALTVEVALCLPILIMILFGSYELARANMILHATESAAYEGARTGIIPGATKEKISKSAEFIFKTVGITDFEIDTIPAEIKRDTKTVEVIVRVPVANNLATPRLFLKNPTFKGSCTLTREVP